MKSKEAFKKILEQRWGRVEVEKKFADIYIPDLSNRKDVDEDIAGVLERIESVRHMKVLGKVKLQLAFDFFLPELKLCIEFDERQHFTIQRAASLRAYPTTVMVGFDKVRWIELSEKIRAEDRYPIYRDEQRALYDSIRDIMAHKAGFLPVIRIYEKDVRWEREGDSSPIANHLLRGIDDIIRTSIVPVPLINPPLVT